MISGNFLLAIKHHAWRPFTVWLSTMRQSIQRFHTWEWWAGMQNYTCIGYYVMVVLHEYRLQLAALHYNHNSSWKQAVTKEGKRRFSVSFPKYKKGGHIVREIKTTSTYGKCSVCMLLVLLLYFLFSEYVDRLLEEVFHLVAEKADARGANVVTIPPFLCCQYQRPVKQDAINVHCSRFSKQWFH